MRISRLRKGGEMEKSVKCFNCGHEFMTDDVRNEPFKRYAAGGDEIAKDREYAYYECPKCGTSGQVSL
jgi:predicted RNA-binding Zn-ribbon protein involved in translation (DUF1610 family)